MQATADADAPLRIIALDAECGTSLPALCSTCHLHDPCLPCGLGGSDLQRLDGLVFSRRKVAAGQALYRAGDRFQSIFAVRTGMFKSSLVHGDGREQVSGFHMVGELIGLDGLAHGRLASTATALEDAQVCVMPYANLMELSASNPGMQHLVGRIMSREIVREHGLLLLLGSMSADERLAAFLLNLSRRFKARGFSANEFHLRMSRAEIGSFLGMKLETVSRTFSAFQQRGLLQVDKRHIRITDLAQLQRLFERRTTTAGCAR